MAKYIINEKVFDIIDTKEKAYWLGFIWSDGYVMKRERKNGYEYALKLELAEIDISHLQKFVSFLDSNIPIHTYKYYGGYITEEGHSSVRVLINRKSIGYNLYENFGIVPNRKSIDKMIERVPLEFLKYFILGVFDADGSVTYYNSTDKDGVVTKKSTIGICGYEQLLTMINMHFIDNGLSETILKQTKRNKESEECCLSISFSGNQQVERILSYLYDGTNDNMRLERKYNKFKNKHLAE